MITTTNPSRPFSASLVKPSMLKWWCRPLIASYQPGGEDIIISCGAMRSWQASHIAPEQSAPSQTYVPVITLAYNSEGYQWPLARVSVRRDQCLMSHSFWSRAGRVLWILDDEGSKWKEVGWRGGDGPVVAEIIGAKRKEHHSEHLV